MDKIMGIQETVTVKIREHDNQTRCSHLHDIQDRHGHWLRNKETLMICEFNNVHPTNVKH